MSNSMLSPSPSAWKTDVLSLYQRLLPAALLQQWQDQAGIRHNNRVYTPLVVMWLFIVQRLHGGAPLGLAVLELLNGLPATFWPRPCKRLRNWQQDPHSLSSHSGAYNQARQRLPLPLVQHSCDRIFGQLADLVGGALPALRTRAFLLDGTSVRMAHTTALLERFPPGSNQYREGHWPLLRMVVAHDLQTGLAMRPQWGPMYGPQAVSEQQLLEAAMDRLPCGSTVVGDANFGVFSVAYTAAQRGYPTVLRLTSARALRLAGIPVRDGVDQPVVWRPSRDDRRRHPDLPADACVRGRLIVREVQPNNGAAPLLLALFTTLQADQDEILNLYGSRWNIETDLRTLKSTLQLDQLTCTTPAMVAKELNLAIAAYNLVRAVICLAAQRSGLPPRSYSFTQVRRVIETFTPLVANAKHEQEAQMYFDRMMHCVSQATLPKRTRSRPSYPRQVWARGDSFPRRTR